jgi:DNA-directed RNA polymerase subunit L
MAEVRESNKLVVKVDVDVSDALKGLKALRREANKTLKALEKVKEATERNVINFVTNVTIQDAIDGEQFAERVRKEIEEHHKAFMERFEAKRQRLSK